MRSGEREPRARELRVIEAFLGEPAPIEIDELMGGTSFVPVRVRVIGNLITGSKVVLLDGRLDEVIVPDTSPIATKAIKIRGDSLGALFDRWLLLYDDVRTPPTIDLRDQLCVIGFEHDTTVKKLDNIATLDGKPILWAAAVRQLVQKITR